jgi:hypothetical protein
MVASGKRRRYLWPREHRAATVMGIILFLVLVINSDTLRTVRRAPVIQAVKQTVQLPRKNTQRHDDRTTFDTYCGLIKGCTTYHQPTVASGKACQGSQDRR